MKKLQASSPSFSYTTILFIVVAVAGCFTPFALFSYAVVIGLLARLRPFSAQFFASYLTRVVVSFLLFCALVMGVGMYCWFIGVAIHPLAVVLPPLGLYLWASNRWQVPWPGTCWANRDDFIALGLALFSIVAIATSFYLPKASIAASVQLATNGFDSGAHLSMIQTTYEEKGYVYGKYEEIKGKIAWKTLTAYPQGWHLANSIFWRGTNVTLFEGSSREGALHFYAFTLMAWLGVATFMLARVSLYAVRLRKMNDQLRGGSLVGFCAINLVVQMVVVWGSFYRGFAAFIAALCYIMLLCAVLLALQERKTIREARHLYFLACAAAMAVGLSWLLPVPVVLLMVLMGFVPLLGARWWPTISSHKKEAWLFVAGTILFLVPLLGMVGVSHFFSVQGKNQINDTGGIFPVSSLLVGLLLLGAGAQWVRDRRWSQVFLAIIAPQLLFTGAVYLYQYVTMGHTEYFFIKSLALLLCILGIFAAGPLVGFLSQLRFTTWPTVSSAIVAVAVVTGLVVFSGQDPSNTATLLQRHSQFTHETATAYGAMASSGELLERNVIVFTQLDYGGDVVGNVLSGALHPGFSQCVGDSVWIITSHRGELFPQFLNNCAKDGEQVTIITSPATQPLFAGIQNSSIRTVMAH